MPRIFGNRIGIVSNAGADLLSDKKSTYNLFDQFFSKKRGNWKYVLEATGGTEFIENGYKYHVFTSSGTFNVTYISPVSNTVEYLVVAGGAGGASSAYPAYNAAGGGAGGIRTGTNFPITVQNYTIAVGAGGAGGTPTPASPLAPYFGQYGNDSVFSTITSRRGGAAGGLVVTTPSGTTPQPGYPGGCGGGSRGNPSTGGVGNDPPVSPPQGFSGGDCSATGAGSGGGGGGVAGQSVTSDFIGGNGGDGIPISWIPPSYGTPGPTPGRWFAGGGGGGGTPYPVPGPFFPVTQPSPFASGGVGGGATCANANPAPSGLSNTGGGGAGVWGNTAGRSGGNGGSGIVIIRYPLQ